MTIILETRPYSFKEQIIKRSEDNRCSSNASEAVTDHNIITVEFG